MKTTNYLDRAKLFGHDPEALKKGEIITSIVTVKTIDEFKSIFAGGLVGEQRNDNSAANRKLMDNVKQSPLPQQMMNLMDYVYGNGKLTKEDEGYAAKLFPIKIQAMSGSDIIIDTDIVKGPFGQPYSINAGNLTFNGGSLTIFSTVLGIAADNLVVLAGGGYPYHVGVIGNVGGIGPAGLPGAPYLSPAANGSDASAPTPGICTGASDGGAGSNGAKGNPGIAPSSTGGNGTASYNADISIKAYDPKSISAFVVYTQSGAGGNGGAGGPGGTGQTGGRGGNGCDSGCEGTDGGKGGDGGAGGDGTDGGNGGNGTPGLPITISFPLVAKTQLQPLSDVASGGNGGDGGMGGAPGSPGSGGTGGKHKSDGANGSGAQAGKNGVAGSSSSKTGAPGNISISYTS